MRTRIAAVLVTVLAVGAFAGSASAGTGASSRARQNLNFYNEHGYLPVDGVRAYRAQKAAAARWVAGKAHAPSSSTSSATAASPAIGASWQGISDSAVTPPDGNGAIGPSRFVEVVNDKIAIYNRSAGTIASGTLASFTGDSGCLSDPMVLWDPNTQRFYYSLFAWNAKKVGCTNFVSPRILFGFSKTGSPGSIGGSDWCNYSNGFGYANGNIPDYPKLGQSTNFLLIGVNLYADINQPHANQSDLLWIAKPQGASSITTCPSLPRTGKFSNLKNSDGSQSWTPVPAIETNASTTGVVVSSSDIECPDICGTGSLLTEHLVRPTTSDPTKARLIGPFSLSVPTFQSPAQAKQKSTSNLLDTLDGRLDHAVAGMDPRFAVQAVWVAHAVLGGAGSAIRWYELSISSTPSLLQTGTVSDPSLYTFNAGISNDRTCTGGGCAHGSSMVLGFTTSSSATFPTDQMVSKVGGGAQSAFVPVHASTTFDHNFSCNPCRWGDYGGATPDPAASLSAPSGQVWLTQQFTTGGGRFSSGDQTWNWQATP
jgi:hypothetical protein